MASGQSIQSSAHMVNVVRDSRGEKPVSWSAVHRFVSNSDIIQTHRRHTKKSGKYDESSIWSRARAAQFLQVLSQLAKGEGRAIAGFDLAASDAMYLRGIVWWDEKYKQCKMSHRQRLKVVNV